MYNGYCLLSGMRCHQWRRCCSKWWSPSISQWARRIQTAYLYSVCKEPIDFHRSSTQEVTSLWKNEEEFL